MLKSQTENIKQKAGIDGVWRGKCLISWKQSEQIFNNYRATSSFFRIIQVLSIKRQFWLSLNWCDAFTYEQKINFKINTGSMNIWNWNWMFTSSTWNFFWNFHVTILVSWTKSWKIEGLRLFSTNESSSPVISLKMNSFLCNYEKILLPKTFCIGLKELCCRTTVQKQPFADVLQHFSCEFCKILTTPFS